MNSKIVPRIKTQYKYKMEYKQKKVVNQIHRDKNS